MQCSPQVDSSAPGHLNDRALLRPASPTPLVISLAMALSVAPLASSCSVVGMQRLPSNLPANEAPECTSSWTMPLADFSGAVLTGSAAVLLHSAASSRENQGKSGSSFRTSAWVATGLALAFIVSGGYGAHQRSRCAAAELHDGPRQRPAWYDEAHPSRGSAGAACKDDKECEGDLICDLPMKTCIEPKDDTPEPGPATPPPSTTPPPPPTTPPPPASTTPPPPASTTPPAGTGTPPTGARSPATDSGPHPAPSP